MNSGLKFQFSEPEQSLAEFVYCFSFLQNFSSQESAVVIPNGKIDLMFSITATGQLQIVLLGLETKPKHIDQGVYNFYSVSFHPLAVEYLLPCSIAELTNSGKILPSDFWGIEMRDLESFEKFCLAMIRKIHSLLPEKVDKRKQELFKLISNTNGEISVSELSDKICWSQRQINRYFKQHLGLSLKSYCRILRFQASLAHIKDGKLYPKLNFTDQSHFIKEVKQFSGVSPKELYKNKNDRFLQFLTYNEQ